MIHIFVVATGIYKNLLTRERVQTFKYLFPSHNKTFNFIGDEDLSIFKDVLSDTYTSFEYYHICQLAYPFITVHKFNYISDMCKQLNYNDDDYFVYLDSHSWCLPHSTKFFNKIIEEDLSQYDICYTTNPYYLQDMIYDEIDTRTKHHVTEREFNEHKTFYGQASFLMGNIKSLHKFAQEINKLITADIMHDGFRKRNSILPNFMEQHYANYIFFDILLNKNTSYGFTVKPDFYVISPKGSPSEVNYMKKTFIICHKVENSKQLIMIESFRNPEYQDPSQDVLKS